MSGGLAILWRHEVWVEVKFFDKYLIDCEIMYGGFKFFVSFVYG